MTPSATAYDLSLVRCSLLDYVGECATVLFFTVYQRPLKLEDSMEFLRRRLYFCLLTGPATVLQVCVAADSENFRR